MIEKEKSKPNRYDHCRHDSKGTPSDRDKIIQSHPNKQRQERKPSLRPVNHIELEIELRDEKLDDDCFSCNKVHEYDPEDEKSKPIQGSGDEEQDPITGNTIPFGEWTIWEM